MRRLVLAVIGLAGCASVLAAAVWADARSDGDASAPVASETSPAGSADETGQAQDGPENPFPGRPPAPGLEGGVDWLNAAGPISLKDLRGKVVLLDFWTYCCINCMHVLPDLKYLEQKFDKELVVIGVHSAKFDNEKESEAIRDAILRYEIAHPVINDAHMLVWRKYHVRAWPTLVLIDPEGHYCGYVSGEGVRDVLEENIEKLIAFHEAKGTLDRTPVRFDLERFKQAETPLRYPGKVLADSASNRLFISDSNHNRIVVTTLDGELLDVIGNGRIGRTDGSFSEAEFDHPQGMALDGRTLYVADTENHLIRVVDLDSKTVTTLAGTGAQAEFRAVGGPLASTALNSPWDLLIHSGVLYVAMAGPHQIWSHTLGSDRIEVWAGTGREDVANGPRLEAGFAQPSGLATDGKALYVCDSEGSAIRRIPFEKEGDVTTVVGPSDLPNGRSLFEFGDIDAKGAEARLQHPIGIAFGGGSLYAADSYNHKVKQVFLVGDRSGESVTLLGTGEAGKELDPLRLSEPAGLSVANRSLFIADTNNHRIVRVDLGTKEAVVLQIEGLAPPRGEREFSNVAEVVDPNSSIESEPQTIHPGKAVTFEIDVSLPEEYKLNSAYPARAEVTAQGPQSIVAATALGKRLKVGINEGRLSFELPLTGESGTATIHVVLNYGYCRGGTGGLCKVKSERWTVPLTVAPDGAGEVRLTASSAEFGRTEGQSSR